MTTPVFSSGTLRLSVAAAVLARCMAASGANVPVRVFLLRGLPLAFGMVLLAALAAEKDVLDGNTLFCKVCRAGLLLWIAAELAGTVREAQRICWEQFSSMAVVGFLPLLLAAGWWLAPEALSRAAKILWVLAVIGGVVCIAGLAGQFRWENLLEAVPTGSRRVTLPLYAEYFLLPLTAEKPEKRLFPCAVWLPMGAFLLEGGYRLGMELLFGRGGYPGAELLRAWTLGDFSRMDALFLLVWLAAALFRVCFLIRLLRQLAEPFWAQEVPQEADS